MTLNQILNHQKQGLTMKYRGQDVKMDNATDFNWKENKATVRFISNNSVAVVSIYDLDTEWTGGAWQAPAAA